MPLIIIAILLILFAKQSGSANRLGVATAQENSNNIPATSTALAVSNVQPIDATSYSPQVQQQAISQQMPTNIIGTVKQAVQIGQTAKDLVSKAASVLTKATPAAVAEVVPAAAAPVIETPAAAAAVGAAPSTAPALGIVAQAVPVIGAMAAIYAGAQALGNAWVGPGPKTVEQNIQESIALKKEIGAAAYAKTLPATAAPDVSNSSLASPVKTIKRPSA